MKLLTVAILTLATTAAYAKSNTEYFFKPAAGQSALKATYNMTSMTQATDPATVDTKITVNDLRLDYGYGLAENQTVGGYIMSGTAKLEVGAGSDSASGMSDLHVYYKGFSDIWHYGADLGFSLANKKADNRSSGGLSLAVNAGALLSSDAWNYGGNLTIGYPFERTTDAVAPATEATKTTGGMTTQIAAFGEYNYGMGFVGAELAQNMVGKTTQKTGAGEATADATSFLSVRPYASYDFNDMVAALLSYQMDMHGAKTGMAAYTANTIALGARILF